MVVPYEIIITLTFDVGVPFSIDEIMTRKGFKLYQMIGFKRREGAKLIFTLGSFKDWKHAI